MKRIFITGVSGYIGNRLAVVLSKAKGIDCLVGLDIQEPDIDVDGMVFVQQDVRAPLAEIFRKHRINTVIHAAWVVKQIHDVMEMEDVNINGTKNVIKACVEAEIDHLIYTSSTTAYGFHPDNDLPLTEESPLRGNEGFTYGKNKKEIEEILGEAAKTNPGLKVTVLRPCFIVGPGFNNDMSEHLTFKIMLLPARTAPIQFIHEDDVIRIILHCLEGSVAGIFNLAGEGTISFEKIAELQGHKVLNVNDKLFQGLVKLLYLLRISRTETAGFDMVRYSWLASPEKFIQQTGFTYKYNTLSSFKHFLEYKRK